MVEVNRSRIYLNDMPFNPLVVDGIKKGVLMDKVIRLKKL